MHRGKERDHQAASSHNNINTPNPITIPNESGSLERVPEDEGPLSFSQLLDRERGDEDARGGGYYEPVDMEGGDFDFGEGRGYTYTG